MKKDLALDESQPSGSVLQHRTERGSEPVCRSSNDLPPPCSPPENQPTHSRKPAERSVWGSCVCSRTRPEFPLTLEFHDLKISNPFLCKTVHKKKVSFMTGVGAKSHNYSHNPENLQLMQKSLVKPCVKNSTWARELLLCLLVYP